MDRSHAVLRISDSTPLPPRILGRIFRVSPRTISSWARAGKIRYVLTPGGHHKFLAATVVEILTAEGVSRESAMMIICQAVSRAQRDRERRFI